ncbi:MAG: hypothetical protein ABIQ18_04580 [Umezawaea sp.]
MIAAVVSLAGVPFAAAGGVRVSSVIALAPWAAMVGLVAALCALVRWVNARGLAPPLDRGRSGVDSLTAAGSRARWSRRG